MYRRHLYLQSQSRIISLIKPERAIEPLQQMTIFYACIICRQYLASTKKKVFPNIAFILVSLKRRVSEHDQEIPQSQTED